MTRFFRSFLTVSGLTSLSRVLGLVRDTLMAGLFGAGILSDVFWAVFKIPNFFRRLLGEGALSVAFVPIFSRLKEAKGYDGAIKDAQGIHTLLLIILGILVLLVECFTPQVVAMIVPGFHEKPQAFSLAVDLTRVTFPYIFFISLAAFYSAILQTSGRFFAASLSPVILNIMMIGSLGLTYYTSFPTHWILAWGVLTAGILQGLFVWMSLGSFGPVPGIVRPRLTETVRAWMKKMLPGILGTSALQINMLVDTAVASLLPTGSISYLFYADRLNQLPLSLLGISISTVLLPTLSQKIAQNHKKAIQDTQNQSIAFAMILVLPAALGLMALSHDIMCLLFERAAFVRQDVFHAGNALRAFVFGLPAYVMVKIFSTCFFARNDTRTPVQMGMTAVILNVLMMIVFIQFLDHVGIALATSCSAWINAMGLGYLLHKRGHMEVHRPLVQKTLGAVTSGLIMVAFLYVCKRYISPLMVTGFFKRGFLLALLIMIGCSIYGLCCLIFKVLDRDEIRISLRKTFSHRISR